MVDAPICRRDLLRVGLATGLLGLAGCSRQQPTLLAIRGDLPADWARTLPSPWRVLSVESPDEAIERISNRQLPLPALLGLGDGWAASLPRKTLQPFAADDLPADLAPLSAPVSRLFAPTGTPALAYPFSYAPWLLILRNRSDLMDRRREGWQLLLDPSLTGKVVLPSSPRVTMALMGNDPERVRRLRRQALAYDDRHGVSLLLAGDAEAMVLPRSRAIPLLRRDPRLGALLPAEGSPLSWNLLLRPAGQAIAPPTPWLRAELREPLLGRLLAKGWVPPLRRSQLLPSLSRFPAPLAELLLPPEAVLDRCVNLPPLPEEERNRLQALWDAAAPSTDGTRSGGPTGGSAPSATE
jgi:hypothetical protein